jgi:type IV secretory pathway TrbD component
MDVRDYPVDVRADYPDRSSRLWAVLTIFWIKWLALIPHFIVLLFLTIAQFVVALIAQFVVVFQGEYPAGMHEFVTGVLRWQTRVTSFFFSLNDRYPPFSLRPLADYPVDVVAERPAQPSRTYAIFTVIVQILAIAGGIGLAVWLIGRADTATTIATDGSSYDYRLNFPSFAGSGLLLRQLAAIPHYVVLFFLGIAAFVLWFVVQWVILFVARFPYGMWEIVAGYVRWYARVTAYALGLVDGYPPFSMSPSSGGGQGARPTAPPPPPPMTATWPEAPGPAGAAPPAPPAPPAPAPEAAPAQPDAAQPEPPQAPASPGTGA